MCYSPLSLMSISNVPWEVWGIVLALVLLVLLASIVISRHNRETQNENDKAMKKLAKSLIEQCRMEGRWRWISDDTMQFVDVVLGRIPGEHRVWARVTIKKSDISVQLETPIL
jgi:hypothetical protein